MTTQERTERGGQVLAEMLGGAEPANQIRQVWRQICPEFEAYVIEFLAGEIWSRPGQDRKTKSLVTIAALAALGRPLALELNLRFALNNGASKQDIVETLLQIAPYAGFPAAWEGLMLLQKVVEHEQKRS